MIVSNFCEYAKSKIELYSESSVADAGFGFGMGSAIVLPPVVPTATGPWFRVDTKVTSLRVRSEPAISTPLTKNVVTELPDGTLVRAFTGNPVNGFIEIEVELGGALFRGFSSKDYLVRVHDEPAVTQPAAEPKAAPRFPMVSMPRKQGIVTKRTEIAGAHSLNEDAMPRRTASEAQGLRTELHAIVAYLNPEKSAHKRYWPRGGLTFCNIYAHDYCMLAGAYLPRVWWTSPALIELSKGKTLDPLYGDTIREMRANDLFRWLRDYGQDYGWRQAVSPTELQLHANQGAVALIIARRKEDGRSGHVTAVVPEIGDKTAKRNSAGNVTAPLQSQAGATNFNYRTSTANWWLAERFAESAFWVHA